MTIHSVRLTTSDGESVSFECGRDETVVEAAARADLSLPVLCRQGNCGTCRGTCRDGEYHLDSHNPAALAPEDAARGEVLLCRTFPRGPLDLAVPFKHSAMTSPVTVRAAEIVAVAPIGGRTIRLALRLEPDENDSRAAEFDPGQFMELTVPDGGVTRAYSLSNTPNWSGELEFLIRLQPGGKFSAWLEGVAAPGQILKVRGPLGGFGLRESGLRPRWFAAGGTGLAPMLSMLRRMAEWQDPHPARLYLGINTDADMFAADELARLKAEMPGVAVEVCVWKPGAGWAGFAGTSGFTGFAGTPADAIKRDLAAERGTPDIYLCGPPAMVSAAERVALEHGIPAEHVISERFLPS